MHFILWVTIVCFILYLLTDPNPAVRIAIMLTLVFMLVLLSGCASTPDHWTKENQRLEMAYQAVHIADLSQTLQIKDHPELRESNWFLGDHPSDGKIAVWYVGTAYGHAFVTSVLTQEGAPRWMCRTWAVLSIGDALNAVRGNYQLGLKVGF